MIKLKEGQELLGEDGNTYLVEKGDCIQSKEKKTMKKVDTKKKVSEKDGKVVITLTKPYLVEGNIIPSGTKILVESSDIYDEYDVSATDSEIATMRRLRRMDYDDYSTPSNIGDASVPNSSNDIYTMRRLARMNAMDIDEEDSFEEEDDFLDEEDDLMTMRRFNRMRRMKAMRRMAKKDKKEEEEDKEKEDDK